MHPILTRSLAALCGLVFAAIAPCQTADAAADLKKIRAEAREAVQNGDLATAVAGFRKVTMADPKDGLAWQLLGYALHAQGKLDEALPIHQKAAEFPDVAGVASYNAACVYALQGKPEDAFAWLDKSAKAGFNRPEQLDDDPDMDTLRKDPRFAEIRKRIAAQAGPDRTQVFAIQTDRKCARVAWFSRTGSPGEIAIDYTPVPWQEKYAGMVGKAEMMGKKWRFGGDFWTSLDTSVDLVIGDVEIPAGYYYLTLEQREGDKVVLGLHDAIAVKKLRIDPFQAARVTGGIEVPLAMAKAEKSADKLDVGIHVASGSLDHGSFDVRFGPFALSAPVLMKVKAGAPAEAGR